MKALDGTRKGTYNVILARKRARPVPAGTSRQPTREPVAAARPETFVEWWAFGLAQAEAARETPYRLHDEDGERDTFERNRQGIGGWPFSVGFKRYLAEDWGKSPFRSAMASLYHNRDRGLAIQCLEYRVLFALISGHTDPDVVRAVTGAESQFEAATIRALTSVYERGEFMRALAIELDGLPLELTEPPAKQKFSLLCRGDCGRTDCAFAEGEGIA